MWTVLFSVDGSTSATCSAVCLYTVLTRETSLKCISLQIHINTNAANSLQDVNTVIWWGAVISASRFHCSCSGVGVIFCSIALQDDMREKLSSFFPALIKTFFFPLWKCGLGGSGPGWNCSASVLPENVFDGVTNLWLWNDSLSWSWPSWWLFCVAAASFAI